MRWVKRAAITVTPKQPYIDWANRLDEDGVKIGEDFQPEQHIYPIGFEVEVHSMVLDLKGSWLIRTESYD
jgi:hypothetical protein